MWSVHPYLYSLPSVFETLDTTAKTNTDFILTKCIVSAFQWNCNTQFEYKNDIFLTFNNLRDKSGILLLDFLVQLVKMPWELFELIIWLFVF